MTKYSAIVDGYPQLKKRLEEHQRMYAALLEIKRAFEKENGKYNKKYSSWGNVYDPRQIWNIACRGLGV